MSVLTRGVRDSSMRGRSYGGKLTAARQKRDFTQCARFLRLTPGDCPHHGR